MILFLLAFVALGRLYRDMFKQAETRALLIVAMIVLAFGVVFYTQVEGWSLLDAIYFCVVTLGTVGYGDITPTTNPGKLFTIIYIVIGLGVIGGFFAAAGRMFRPEQFLAKGGSRLAGIVKILPKQDRLQTVETHLQQAVTLLSSEVEESQGERRARLERNRDVLAPLLRDVGALNAEEKARVEPEAGAA
jgi:hypothetical protein